MLLENRVAIVTGGAKGMGKAIALKFAEEGCSVAIADISMKEANETLSEVLKKGREALALECNVTDETQVRRMTDQVLAKFGKVDILVNNAGAAAPSPPTEDLPVEEWDKVMNINLKSGFLCSKAVIPNMKANKYGKIVNISSLGALFPHADVVHYAAAKAGVLGMTFNLAYALARYNICVNAILPGLTKTHFYDVMLNGVPDKEAFFAEIGKGVPLRRAGKPEDIAGAALFYASELSSYVTGTTLNVSGGEPLPLCPDQ
jgi:3-oxoacyl-[acyl-carrier protein] reductase